nr:MAG TPA_asm: hypothetical protein [Caudoviricetes sp.]
MCPNFDKDQVLLELLNFYPQVTLDFFSTLT